MNAKETRNYLRTLRTAELNVLEKFLREGARKMQGDLMRVRREIIRRKRATSMQTRKIMETQNGDQEH